MNGPSPRQISRAVWWHWRQPGMRRALVGPAISLAALLTCTFVVLRWLAAGSAIQPGNDTALVVYLSDAVDGAAAQTYAAQLAAQPYVARAEYVAPAEAARRLRAALGSHPELVAELTDAAMPHTVELVVATASREVLLASPMFNAIATAQGVEAVDWVGQASDPVGQQLESQVALARRILGWLVIAVAVAVIALRWWRPDAPTRRAALAVGASPSLLAWPAALAAVGTVAASAMVALVATIFGPRDLLPSSEPQAWLSHAVVITGGVMAFAFAISWWRSVRA